ncbi:MAG TPA: cobalt transporter [Gammaproteobacteria bacterium]|nr:cobalt transporter [Gammaproteobacteria bacterium]
MLRSILISAILVGTISGIFLTAVQQYKVTPLILEAETYESSDDGHSHTHEKAESTEHADKADSHSHDESDQRLLLSLLSNIFAGIAFAFITEAAIVYSEQKGWAKGILWGLAGFIVFYAAPSLGLHPKLPGTSGAPLLHQQLWWVATATATAAGIAMLVFSSKSKSLFKAIGVLLLASPHIVGAPVPAQIITSVPDLLMQKFVIASALTNVSFWLVLGVLSGYFLYKFDNHAAE